MKLATLQQQTRALAVPVKIERNGEIIEDTIHLVHRMMTPKLWRELSGAATAADRQRERKQGAADMMGDSIVRELMALLVSWDVEGDGGEPAPITPESLGLLSFDVLKAIDVAIFTQALPQANGQDGK